MGLTISAKLIDMGTLNLDTEILEMDNNKPECELSECDGNVFFIIGRVSKALKRAGMSEKAAEWYDKATKCESYDAVIQLAFEYVDVC